MTYELRAWRVNSTGGKASSHGAETALGTNVSGRSDALNPVELLMSALAACMIKGIERVSPKLDFAFDAVEVRLTAERQDSPPKLMSINYEVVIKTEESDHRLDLLLRNVLKYGTISNTLAVAVPLTGTIRRA